MAPNKQRTPERMTPGPDDTDLDQEIPTILAEEAWVIQERRQLEAARAWKVAWLRELGLDVGEYPNIWNEHRVDRLVARRRRAELREAS